MKISNRPIRDCRGQSIVEFAMIAPFIVVISLGVVELGYGLLDQHVVTKLAREGANLISRDVNLETAATAMRNMATRPVDFSNGSRVIFSVIKRGDTTGTSNYDKDLLYQRYQSGSGSGTSGLTTRGPGSFGSEPEHVANNSNGDTNLQLTNLPPGLLSTPGGMVYVCEVYTQHPLITPFNRFGVNVPTTLYSIAFF